VPDNGAVTWTAGGGTIDSSGVFTAGSTAGTFTVRATKVGDPDSFAEATVTVLGGSGLTLEFARALSLLSRGIASDFFCPSGPTTEPSDLNNSYFTQTPFGRHRDGLSTPPPNVGRFFQVLGGTSANLKANCRFVSEQANSSEIVLSASVSGTTVTFQSYVSSTTKFGLPAGGEADVFLQIPADGFIDVTVNTSWLKGLGLGEATVAVSNFTSGGYNCQFNPVAGNIAVNCEGPTHIPVFKGRAVQITTIISGNGEGSGLAVTLTYTRNQ
jgi:hypothetical protein